MKLSHKGQSGLTFFALMAGVALAAIFAACPQPSDTTTEVTKYVSVGAATKYLNGDITSADVAAAIGSGGSVVLDASFVTSIDGTGVADPTFCTKLGDCFDTAAEGSTRVSTLILPSIGLTEIAALAFENCSGLARVVIPASVTTIADNAFRGCAALTNIAVHPSNADFSTLPGGKGLTNKAGTTLLAYPTAGGAVSDIPSGTTLTTIGGSAFANNAALTSIVIPDGVTTIENGAFQNCINLASVTIPGSVSIIGSTPITTFVGCERLTSFIVSGSNFSSIEGGKILVRNGDRALVAYPTASGVVTIPSGVTVINVNAFHGNGSMTSITIPSSVRWIGAGGGSAFINCTALANVIIEGNASMQVMAFDTCAALTSVIFQGNPVLWNNVFNNCANLTTVVFESDSADIRYDSSFPAGTPSLKSAYASGHAGTYKLVGGVWAKQP